MPTNVDYVNVLLPQVGKRYCNEGPWRCTMQFGCADCSGFDCWGLNQLGIAYPCSNTDLMAYDLKRKGLLVSEEEAREGDGYWAIRLTGSHHMVCTIGARQPGKVVEAASHALGIRIGNFDGRDFTVFGRPPGLIFPGDAGQLPTPGGDVRWFIIMHPTAGYWCVNEKGEVFTYGTPYYGGAGATLPSGKKVKLNGPVTSAAASASGKGYALITDKGSLYAFGDFVNKGDPHP